MNSLSVFDSLQRLIASHFMGFLLACCFFRQPNVCGKAKRFPLRCLLIVNHIVNLAKFGSHFHARRFPTEVANSASISSVGRTQVEGRLNTSLKPALAGRGDFDLVFRFINGNISRVATVQFSPGHRQT